MDSGLQYVIFMWMIVANLASASTTVKIETSEPSNINETSQHNQEHTSHVQQILQDVNSWHQVSEVNSELSDISTVTQNNKVIDRLASNSQVINQTNAPISEFENNFQTSNLSEEEISLHNFSVVSTVSNGELKMTASQSAITENELTSTTHDEMRVLEAEINVSQSPIYIEIGPNGETTSEVVTHIDTYGQNYDEGNNIAEKSFQTESSTLPTVDTDFATHFNRNETDILSNELGLNITLPNASLPEIDTTFISNNNASQDEQLMDIRWHEDSPPSTHNDNKDLVHDVQMQSDVSVSVRLAVDNVRNSSTSFDKESSQVSSAIDELEEYSTIQPETTIIPNFFGVPSTSIALGLISSDILGTTYSTRTNIPDQLINSEQIAEGTKRISFTVAEEETSSTATELRNIFVDKNVDVLTEHSFIERILPASHDSEQNQSHLTTLIPSILFATDTNVLTEFFSFDSDALSTGIESQSITEIGIQQQYITVGLASQETVTSQQISEVNTQPSLTSSISEIKAEIAIYEHELEATNFSVLESSTVSLTEQSTQSEKIKTSSDVKQEENITYFSDLGTTITPLFRYSPEHEVSTTLSTEQVEHSELFNTLFDTTTEQYGYIESSTDNKEVHHVGAVELDTLQGIHSEISHIISTTLTDFPADTFPASNATGLPISSSETISREFLSDSPSPYVSEIYWPTESAQSPKTTRILGQTSEYPPVFITSTVSGNEMTQHDLDSQMSVIPNEATVHTLTTVSTEPNAISVRPQTSINLPTEFITFSSDESIIHDTTTEALTSADQAFELSTHFSEQLFTLNLTKEYPTVLPRKPIKHHNVTTESTHSTEISSAISVRTDTHETSSQGAINTDRSLVSQNISPLSTTSHNGILEEYTIPSIHYTIVGESTMPERATEYSTTMKIKSTHLDTTSTTVFDTELTPKAEILHYSTLQQGADEMSESMSLDLVSTTLIPDSNTVTEGLISTQYKHDSSSKVASAIPTETTGKDGFSPSYTIAVKEVENDNKSFTEKETVTYFEEHSGHSTELPTHSYFQTSISDLNKEELDNVITAFIKTPDGHCGKEWINNQTLLFHMWLVQTVMEGIQNHSANWPEITSAVFDLDIAHNITLPVLFFVLPSPWIHNEDLILSFFVRKFQNNGTISADELLPLLVSNADRLLSILNLNVSLFIRGPHDVMNEHNGYVAVDIVINKYGVLIIAISLIILVLSLVFFAAVIYNRRRNGQCIHNITDRDKLHRVTLAMEIGDLNPAAVILQDEIYEKSLITNGARIVSVGDDESWVVPITDVPVEDSNAPDVQDTKL